MVRWIATVALMALASGCLSAGNESSGTDLALGGALLAPPPLAPFVVDAAACEESSLAFTGDAATVRELVPSPFTPVGAAVGRSPVVVLMFDCASVALGGTSLGPAVTGGLFVPIAPPDEAKDAVHLYLVEGFTNRAAIAAQFATVGTALHLAPAYLQRHPDLWAVAMVRVEVPIAGGGYDLEGFDAVGEAASASTANWVVWADAGAQTLRLDLDLVATQTRHGEATLKPDAGSTAARLAGAETIGPLATFGASFRGRADLLEM